jgi:adenosine deaminase
LPGLVGVRVRAERRCDGWISATLGPRPVVRAPPTGGCPPANPALLAEYFTFTDFAHFVEAYLSVVDLIRDAEDVATLTYDIGAGLATQSVRYAEVTLSPYSSIVRGIPAEAYCEALEDARRRAARDPDLMAHLREHDIALEVCPTSSVDVGAGS